MNPNIGIFFGLKQEPKTDLKGISKEIADLEKKLKDKQLEKETMIQVKNNLINLLNTWNRIIALLNSEHGNDDFVYKGYPFDDAMEDIDIEKWVNKSVKYLDSLGI